MMRAILFLAVCLGAATPLLFADAAAAHTRRAKVMRAPGGPRLGPWVEEGWQHEDWSRAPAVREWGWSAPWDYDPATGYPSATAEYPWGYTTPFARVGKKCIANELNASPGGLVVRYQRVMPSYYCP